MKKALISSALVGALLFSVVAPAQAAQSQADADATATKAALTQIVSPAVDSAYASIESTMASLVKTTVKSTVGTSASLKTFVKPLLTNAVVAALAQYGIEDQRLTDLVDQAFTTTLESQLVTKILDSSFTQAVIDRTVDYAVADIVDQLGIDAEAEAVKAQLVEKIYNAPYQTVGTAPTQVKGDSKPSYSGGIGINTSYYAYTVNSWNQESSCVGIVLAGRCIGVTRYGNSTPSDITVTGWNTSTINTVVSATVGISSVSSLSTAREKLANIDLAAVLVKAVQKAIVDEIKYRIDTFIEKVKTQIVTALQTRLKQIGVTVTLSASDSYKVTFQKILTALKAKGIESIPKK
ncbi:MAG: hypothetical protein LBR20_03585 [Propionibacteriaceae bacterium]|jgi:uncharacterized low-complexity protein|nr:hypothetical protein [Propionibacteriaceae bacterium]